MELSELFSWKQRFDVGAALGCKDVGLHISCVSCHDAAVEGPDPKGPDQRPPSRRREVRARPFSLVGHLPGRVYV